MRKIRIPRKLKKNTNRIFKVYAMNFPYVPKLIRYIHWEHIEKGMKIFDISAEELYYEYGAYTKDDVIWWHWVRWKELGIEPKMSADFQEYWDFFVEKGVIHKKCN
jgi:hypothetical protein